MAKMNNVLGKGAGSIGSVTFQVLNGQQVAKAKVTNVKNPRTKAQMYQRLRWANIVLLWCLSLNTFLKGFFSKKQTWSWFNAFMSLNLKSEKIFLPKNYVDRKACVVAPYKISDGPLSRVSVSNNGGDILLNTELFSTVPESVTIGAVSQAIIAKIPGMQNGDALCFISICNTFDSEGYPHLSVERTKFILDTESTSTDLGNDLSVSSTSKKLVYAVDEPGVVQGYAIVHTRNNGSKIETSSETLAITDDWYENFTGDAALERAIKTYNGELEEVFYDPGQRVGGVSEPIIPEPTE